MNVRKENCENMRFFDDSSVSWEWNNVNVLIMQKKTTEQENREKRKEVNDQRDINLHLQQVRLATKFLIYCSQSKFSFTTSIWLAHKFIINNYFIIYLMRYVEINESAPNFGKLLLIFFSNNFFGLRTNIDVHFFIYYYNIKFYFIY